ncbi:MAG TPA: hypothetical protein VJ969_04580 [Desulfopila sp.]|nr:hypothetical protein [Desulfopila sp.]
MKTQICLNKKMIFAVIAVFALILGGCVSGKQKLVDQGNKPLTNMELKEIFTQKQVADGTNSEGHSFVVTWLPDGSQSALSSSGKTYTGTYYFDGDKYCSKLDHRDFVRCTTWFKVGENKYKLFREGEPGGSTLVLRE